MYLLILQVRGVETKAGLSETEFTLGPPTIYFENRSSLIIQGDLLGLLTYDDNDKTAKGTVLVMFQNFTYFKYKCKLSSGTRWKCCRHSSRKCNAYLIIDYEGVIVKTSGEHRHDPIEIKNQINLFVSLTTIKFPVIQVKGRNGKDLLILNGYTYYKHKLLRDGYRWSCTQMGSRSCRGFLHVTKNKIVAKAFTEHTHAPSKYFLESIRRTFAVTSNAFGHNQAFNPFSMKISDVHGGVQFS
nr:uncharacterized protein LOC128672690 [Plodia interpunctella]